jgi:Ca-activated chloride channel homolog
MSWASPLWFAALVVVPFLVAVVVVGGWWHRRKLTAVFQGEMLERIWPASVRRRRVARDVAVLMGLVLVVVSLAEPRFGKEIRTLPKLGTNLVIALDVSRSMLAEDVKPSRLERARREIADLVDELQADRVALVLYAGGAYPRLPLTEDHLALMTVVSESGPDVFEAQGSSLGAAIRTSVGLLKGSAEPAGQGIVVLSDGEDHDPVDATAAAAEAAELGVAIFAVGIGSESAPIPLGKGGFLTRDGEVVMSTPSEEVLREVAKATGGAFVGSVASSEDIQSLYTEIRRTVRATERGTEQRELWRTAFQVPLGAGLLLLLAAAWLGDGRRPWGAAVAVFLVAMLHSSVAQAGWSEDLKRAMDLAAGDHHAAAAQQLGRLAVQSPGDPDIFDRLATSRYRAGEYVGAARAWDRARQLRGGTDDTSSYNAANALHRAGRLEEAIRRYEGLTQREEPHPGAAHNLPLVLEELGVRRKMRPPPPPPPSGDGEREDPGDSSQDEGEEDSTPQGGTGEGSEQSDESDGEGEEESKSEAEGAQGEGSEGEGDASDAQPNDIGEGTGSSSLEASGPITEGQAHRMLDAVEEGHQQLVVSGDSTGHDW